MTNIQSNKTVIHPFCFFSVSEVRCSLIAQGFTKAAYNRLVRDAKNTEHPQKLKVIIGGAEQWVTYNHEERLFMDLEHPYFDQWLSVEGAAPDYLKRLRKTRVAFDRVSGKPLAW